MTIVDLLDRNARLYPDEEEMPDLIKKVFVSVEMFLKV
mgnify:CR=1 FL=1